MASGRDHELIRSASAVNEEVQRLLLNLERQIAALRRDKSRERATIVEELGALVAHIRCELADLSGDAAAMSAMGRKLPVR